MTISDLGGTAATSIFYTIDGSTPTVNSPLYTGPITVNSTETVQAIATQAGYAQSAVGSAVYTFPPLTATPRIWLAPGTYTSVQTVKITDATSGATVYYTTNGSIPTTASQKNPGLLTVSSSETIQAMATAAGHAQSLTATAAYIISPPATTPLFSPAAGAYSTEQFVTITCATKTSTIYFTLDGSTPTASSFLYAGPIPVTSTETIKAIAVAPAIGDSPSAVASAAYTLNPPPLILSLTPDSVAAGSGPITLTVTGLGFTSSSVVRWNGTPLATSYVSPAMLTVPIPASTFTVSATVVAAVSVVNPAPGGVSNTAELSIVAPSAAQSTVPVIASLTPDSVATGSGPITLTVTGLGFTSSSVVQWNGSSLPTHYVSPTSLTVQIPASAFANRPL